MKKVMILSMVLIMAFLGFNMNADASTINVLGYVNPYVGTQIPYDATYEIFTQVDYRFDVIGASPNTFLYQVSLTFEDDAFFVDDTITMPVAIAPPDWSIDWDITGLYPQLIAEFGGTPLFPSQSLAFSVANVVAYDAALADATVWDEGQIWGQGFGAMGYDYRLQEIASSAGGSTTPVPEPGTLMLLGSGLAGVGFYTRRKKK